ncbi:MAG: aspartate--tRNA ligase, partial [Stappiaceae bacterium]
MHRYRSHTCGQLRENHVGEAVRLSGWVHRVRDHGGLLFIDLRDHYGLTQCVVDPDSSAFSLAETVRSEWVIQIEGDVKKRSDDAINTNIPTGHIEIFIRDLEVLGASKELPLPVFGEPDYPEETRLKYRFIDLRRETLHDNIMKRSAVISSLRRRMDEIEFTDYQTPILTASSPEGARDFLVPSRIHPGGFYALPQAPQQFKQLLMMAGFDKYYQIAPCFRDEDPRADRLPGEFYQLDVEMSFVTQDDVLETMEPVIRGVFEEFADGKSVTQEFPRIPHDEALRKYGSDKPDLRNPIIMDDVTEHFAGSGFKIFARMIESDPKVQVWAIPAKTGGSRAFCDRMNSWAQSEGQPGLGYIFFREEGGTVEGAGPLAKNIGPERTAALRGQLDLEAGDAVFFVAGVPSKFVDFAGKARDRVGQDLDLVKTDQFALCWIVDFPMYEWDEENEKVDFSHNPFSMPQGELDGLNTEDPLELGAYQYDVVCNGYEIGSGAIRNHRPEIMRRAFEIAGYSADVLEERFGGMLRALEY